VKITHVETKTVEAVVTDDILCNYCGKSCHTGDNYEGVLEHRIQGGYGSQLGDMVSWIFSLCETCLGAEIFPKFKIPPQRVSAFYERDEEEYRAMLATWPEWLKVGTILREKEIGVYGTVMEIDDYNLMVRVEYEEDGVGDTWVAAKTIASDWVPKSIPPPPSV